MQIAPGDVAFVQLGCPPFVPVTSLERPFAEILTSFGDGDYLIGRDIMDALMYATGPAPGETCHWERRTGFGGTDDEIVESSTFTRPPDGPQEHPMVAPGGPWDGSPRTTAFTTDGCGTWHWVDWI